MARGETNTKERTSLARRRSRARRHRMPVCDHSFLTRREAAELAGTSLSSVNKAIEQRAIPVHRSGGQPLLDADGVALLTTFDRAGVRLPIELKREVRDWLVSERPHRRRSRSSMRIKDGTLVIDVTDEVRERADRASRYPALRNRYLVSDPDILGGWPVIKGTRILAEMIARRIDGGDTLERLESEYPTIPRDAFVTAYMYAKSHPRRGRPAKPWRTKEPV